MAPRGLSADEKRIRLVEIFHETKDFFQLRELEKSAPKMKGIVQQSVKEVLQSLVDDGLVQTDKIGSSNIYWSFPSQHGAIMTNRLNVAKEKRESLQSQLQDLQDDMENERLMRPDSSVRTSALSELAATKAQLGELEKELAQYGSCDPAKIEEKNRTVELAHEAAIRWTDNVGVLIPHLSRQNGTDPSEIRAYLEIGEDFEDVC